MTAAIASMIARQTNTASVPYDPRISRIPGMMNAVAIRPTPDAQPKPDARALVGNTSEQKICIALPATWTKKTITKPVTRRAVSLVALANTMTITPAAMKAQTEV